MYSQVRPRRALPSCSSAVPGVRPGLSHRVLLWRGKRRRRPRGRQSPARAPVRVPRRSRACHARSCGSTARRSGQMWTVSAAFGERRRQPRLVTHRPSSTGERGRQHGPRSRVLEASVRPRHSLALSSEKTVSRGLEGFVNCCSTAQPDLKSPRRVSP